MGFNLRCIICGRSRKARSDKLPIMVNDKVTKQLKGFICSLCARKARKQEYQKQNQGVKK